MDLSGTVAIVTGSGRGFGLAYAREFTRNGAAVAEVVPVGTSAAAQSLVDRAVGAFGRLDIPVNNAGILRGTFTCTRAAAVRTREHGEGDRIVGTVRTWAMVDALKTGDPLLPIAGQQLGFGTPEDAAGPVAFRASDGAAGITGQAVGIGGDRLALWSHPDPDAFAPSLQTVGQQLPKEPS